MDKLVIYTACDMNYFNIYFKLWADSFNSVYPNVKKIISIYRPTEEAIEMCRESNIEVHDAQIKNPNEKGAFYLLRWLNLPFEHAEKILETQINCLAVKPLKHEHIFDSAEQIKLSYLKKQALLGAVVPSGITAAIFDKKSAKKVVEYAQSLKYTPTTDTDICVWMDENLKTKKILVMQQIKKTKASKIELYDHCCFIKSPNTGKKTPIDKKIAILKAGLLAAKMGNFIKWENSSFRKFLKRKNVRVDLNG